MRDQENIAKPP